MSEQTFTGYKVFQLKEWEDSSWVIQYGNWGYGSISLSPSEEVCRCEDQERAANLCSLLNWVMTYYAPGTPPHQRIWSVE